MLNQVFVWFSLAFLALDAQFIPLCSSLSDACEPRDSN